MNPDAPSVRVPRAPTTLDRPGRRPRAAALPADGCGDDLAARTAGRVARTLGAGDLPGLTTSRVRGGSGVDGGLRAVLDRLTGRLRGVVGVDGDRQRGRPGSRDPDPGSTQRGTQSPGTAPPVPDLPIGSARRRDRAAHDSSAAAARGTRPDGPRGTAEALVPDGRSSRRSPSAGTEARDLRRRDPRSTGDSTGRGEGTDAVLRAPDGTREPGDRGAGSGRRRPDGTAAGSGLPELPDRPGRLVALGGAGLDDSPHDGSSAGVGPSALAGTLGTSPQPTVWDSSGVGGVGGAVPAVSAPVLERLLERVLDDAARRHGIEV